MYLKRLALGISTLIICINASKVYAADGYKNIKFGITIEELKKINICTLDVKVNIKYRMVAHTCTDFKFNNKSQIAYFYFIDGKLKKITFSAGRFKSNMTFSLNALQNKYGPPSSPLKPIALEKLDNGKKEFIFVGFDNDTVFLWLSKPDDTILIAISYLSSDYYEKEREIKKRKKRRKTLII